MKIRILRWLCENTGNILRLIGVLLFVITMSADMTYSSFRAVFILLAISSVLIGLGSFLDKYLQLIWKLYVIHRRKERKNNALRAA